MGGGGGIEVSLRNHTKVLFDFFLCFLELSCLPLFDTFRYRFRTENLFEIQTWGKSSL